MLLACETVADTASEGVGCDRNLTWQNYADGFFRSYCLSCHSATAADRHEATVGVDFDTQAQVLDQLESIYLVIDGGAMPPGGGLTDDDLALIHEWLVCGDR